MPNTCGLPARNRQAYQDESIQYYPSQLPFHPRDLQDRFTGFCYFHDSLHGSDESWWRYYVAKKLSSRLVLFVFGIDECCDFFVSILEFCLGVLLQACTVKR